MQKTTRLHSIKSHSNNIRRSKGITNKIREFVLRWAGLPRIESEIHKQILSIEKEHGSQAYVGGAMSSFHMNPCGPRGSPLGSYSGGFESFPEDPVLDRGIRSFVCPVAHFQNIFQRILRVLVPTILTAHAIPFPYLYKAWHYADPREIASDSQFRSQLQS